MEAFLSFPAFQSTLPSFPRPSLPCFHLNCSYSSSSLSSSFSGSWPNGRKQRLRVRLSAAGSGRVTLSSSWDLSASSSHGGPWMSRFVELDTINMLLKQRIVFLGSRVDTVTADFIISQLLFLDAEDQEKDIKLFINSPGGSVTAGMRIYDAMKLCKADISTVCLGLAASMGAFLLAAETKGKRFCMPNSRMMIHQPLGIAGGKVPNSRMMIHQPLGF